MRKGRREVKWLGHCRPYKELLDTHTGTRNMDTNIHTHVHTYSHTHAHTCTHIFTHTCTHTYTHIFTHTCTRIFTHTCTHIFTHTHAHTYSHTHLMQSCKIPVPYNTSSHMLATLPRSPIDNRLTNHPNLALAEGPQHTSYLLSHHEAPQHTS